jgi:hypothetical protein
MRMLTRHAQGIYKDQWSNVEGDLTPVDVTPIAKWMQKSSPDISVTDDMAQIMPPWPHAWVEYVALTDDLERVGVNVETAPIDQIEIFGLSDRSDISVDEEEVATISMLTVFVEAKSNSVDLLATIAFPIGYDGFAITSEALVDCKKSFLKECPPKKASSVIGWLIRPVLFGFSLCHANNVSLYEDEVPKPVQKKRRKSGKNPGKTFKCLDIEPMKKQSRRESDEGESDVERALHICRGHFKTYTEENPLFGEHTGTYWWPMHVRGNEDAGEVEKSYRVNEPNE